jgi:hypothetical protein
MDISHTHSQQAISPSLPQSTELSSTTQPPLPTHITTSDSSRTLRSTTRARAAKQTVAKDNDFSDHTPTSAPAESSSRQTRSNYHPYPSKRTRDTKGKGKSQEITEEHSHPRSHKKYVPLTHHTYHSRRTLLTNTTLTQRPPDDLSRHFFRSYYQRTHP